MESKYGKNILEFYAYSFLCNMMFMAPVIVLFWQSNGLSMTELMAIEACFSMGLVLFQVPTGAFADKVGRKSSMMIGSLIMAVSAVIYSMGHGFWHFISAELIWALGLSFCWGADSAMIYDTMKQLKSEQHFKKVWGNVQAMKFLAYTVAAIIGGFVASYSYRWNWLLMAFTFILSFFVALSFREPRHFRKVGKVSYWKHSAESLRETFGNRNLRYLLLMSALLLALGKISFLFCQPYLLKSGVSIAYFGVISALAASFGMIASKSAHKIEEIFTERWIFWAIVLSMCLSFVFMSFMFMIFGIIFVIIQQVARGLSEPIVLDYTNRHIPTEKRATMLSVQSMFGSFVAAMLLPLFGLVSDTWSFSVATMGVAVFFLLAFLILTLWKNSGRK